MRISDWSSYVCSSDLDLQERQRRVLAGEAEAAADQVQHGNQGNDDQGQRQQDPDHFAGNRVRCGGLRGGGRGGRTRGQRSEEHTSELQSLMRISYAVFCLKKKNPTLTQPNTTEQPQSNNNK